MKLNKKVGDRLQWLAISIGGALVAHLSAPDVAPAIIPDRYLPLALVGLQVAQKFLQSMAWNRNPDGSPASLPALPDPESLPR